MAGGPDFFGEEEVLLGLKQHRLAMGVDNEAAEAQVQRLTRANTSLTPAPMGTMSAGGTAALVAVEAGEWSAQDSLPALADLAADVVDAEAVAEEEPAAADDEEDEAELKSLLAQHELPKQEAPQGFVVSITRGGRCRRLHFAGGCFRVAGEHFSKHDDFGQSEPEEHQYNFRCKDCFPALKPAAAEAEELEEASDSDSSSSTSSSEDDVDGEEEES